MSILIILGFILVAAGLLFCFLPVLPGPALSYLALILLSFGTGWEAFSPTFLILMAVAVVLASVMDNVIPILTSRSAGASPAGTWGAFAGMIVGVFFFPPFGFFLGTLVGAVAGELFFNPAGGNAIRAGWGVFVGTLLGIGLKVAVCAYIAWVYFHAVV